MGTITSTRRPGDHAFCEVKTADPVNCLPGQYLQCRPEDLTLSTLAHSLFPTQIEGTRFEAMLPEQVDWNPGTQLTVRGGLGSGFKLPVVSTRISLIALDRHPYRLASLAKQAASTGKDLNLFIDIQAVTFDPMDFPRQMEILPLEQFSTYQDWPEFVAIDVAKSDLGLMKQFALGCLTCSSQVLVHTSMPCGAMADCGVCSMKCGSEIKYLCKDGPVLEMSVIQKFFKN